MELSIPVPEGSQRTDVVGASERNLKMIREALGVNVSARGGTVRLEGDDRSVRAAKRVLEQLDAAARRRAPLSRRQVLDAIAGAMEASERPDAPPAAQPTEVWDRLGVYVAGRRIEPKSEGQRAYMEAIRAHDLTFGVGPAGTGKTYLAVAAAVHMLKAGTVRKVVLARPAVEAGEKLGFLPGDVEAKVNPYLRPLLDALEDMVDFQTLKRFMMSDVVEVVPLAFMRGRTLNDAVVILDEAQNATRGQMKMFLTRLGQRSRMIVTGDPTQTDLPDAKESGLVDAIRRLRRVRGVEVVALGGEDIVRHDLVSRIVEAYGQTEEPSAQDVAARLDLRGATADDA